MAPKFIYIRLSLFKAAYLLFWSEVETDIIVFVNISSQDFIDGNKKSEESTVFTSG